MPEIKDSLVNSLIGAGSAVDGDLDVDGMLRVDGDLRGSIRATGKVVIGEAGRIEASIRARSAIVGGLVKGDLYVTDRARLLSGAVVLGNVFAPRLEAEDGAMIHGEVAITGRPEAAEDELRSFVEHHGDPLRFLGRFRAADFTAAERGPAASPRSLPETLEADATTSAPRETEPPLQPSEPATRIADDLGA